MVPLSLFFTLMLLNCCLLISANGGHDHDDHHHDDDDCRRSANTVTSCEGSVLRLYCPGHAKIKILAANYGRTDRRTCSKDKPRSQIQNTNCRLSNSLPIVSGRCDRRESCSVPATNGVFSDPCRGTYKFLRVTYCCKRRRS